MVTLIKYGALSGGEKYNVNQMYIDGLSTDTKPTSTIDGMGIPNGSVFTEVDTGTTYMYDSANATWYEVSIGGGGGGTQGGIVLVGETTTALTDGATTNPITVDGQSYTAQANDAVIYLNKEFLFDGTKWHEFGDLSGLASKDIGAMTGYEKPNVTSAISTSDTLNQAVGKLEKALDGKQATIDANNKLSSDLVDDTNKTHKFATQAQLDQIETNKNNISMFHKANGTEIFYQELAPSRDKPQGSYWISTSGIKILRVSDNLFNTTGAQTGFIDASGNVDPDPDFLSTVYIDVTESEYTISTTSDMTEKIAFRIAQYDSNNVFLSRIVTTRGAQSYQYEPASTVAKIRISYYANADGLLMTDVNWY